MTTTMSIGSRWYILPYSWYRKYARGKTVRPFDIYRDVFMDLTGVCNPHQCVYRPYDVEWSWRKRLMTSRKRVYTALPEELWRPISEQEPTSVPAVYTVTEMGQLDVQPCHVTLGDERTVHVNLFFVQAMSLSRIVSEHLTDMSVDVMVRGDIPEDITWYRNIHSKDQNRDITFWGCDIHVSVPTPTPATLLTQLETVVNCVICMDNVRQVAFMPCGHCCSCHQCASGLRECPMCRSVVDRYQTIYLS